MSSPQRATSEILKDVQDTLETAEMGFIVLTKGSPEKKLCGLRNLVVFGRAVTFVLKNLRSTEPKFDELYSKYSQEMQSDELLSHFKELRNILEKEDVLKLSAVTHIRRLNLPEDLVRFGPPPPNAKGFFIGDRIGGTGWKIQLPNGSVDKYYASLPSDIGSVSLHFPKSPKSHLGKRILDSRIESLSRKYLDYLQKLVKDAKETFELK